MEEDKREYKKYIKAKKQVEEIKGFYIHLVVYLVINAFLLVPIFRYVSPDELNIWSFSTAIFWGIGLAFHAYSAFGKHLMFSKEWEERKIKEFMEKDKKEYWE